MVEFQQVVMQKPRRVLWEDNGFIYGHSSFDDPSPFDNSSPFNRRRNFMGLGDFV